MTNDIKALQEALGALILGVSSGMDPKDTAKLAADIGTTAKKLAEEHAKVSKPPAPEKEDVVPPPAPKPTTTQTATHTTVTHKKEK